MSDEQRQTLTPSRRIELIQTARRQQFATPVLDAAEHSQQQQQQQQTPLAADRRAALLDSARRHRADVHRTPSSPAPAATPPPLPPLNIAATCAASAAVPSAAAPAAPNCEWRLQLQTDLAELRQALSVSAAVAENEDDAALAAAFSAFHSGVASLPRTRPSAEVEAPTSSVASLREAAAIVHETQQLARANAETRNGPLAALQRKHAELDAAIEQTAFFASQESEELDRQMLIARYRNDIRALKRQISLRPPASEVKLFRERLESQVLALSQEMASVVQELSILDGGDEKGGELQRSVAECESLAVELAALQEQLGGIASYVSSQRDAIRSWTERERPRHEHFIVSLERERDELIDRCVSRGLIESPRRNNNAAGEEEGGGGIDDDAEQSLDSSLHYIVDETTGKRRTVRRPATVIEVVQVGDEGRVETTKVRAPRRTAAIVRFVDGADDQNPSSASAAAAASSSSQSSSLGTVLATAVRIYTPPLVTYENNTTNRTKAKPHSLTVRMLSNLSSWLFGTESWVEAGKKPVRRSEEKLV